MPNKNYDYLKDKWTKKHREIQNNLVDKHRDSISWLADNSKQLALSSLGSLVLLTSPLNKPMEQARVAAEQAQKVDRGIFVISDLVGSLPEEVRALDDNEEASISATLTRLYGIKVAPEINGLRLNRSYGLIGQEQHLARYPGDSMATHFDDPQDAAKYAKHDMAPGLGAWGYFTTSASQMTEEDNQREKYYLAVQTFLAPDFGNKVAVYRDFFKFRKMLVVNPQNGKAVVAVIGDAGPAEWTGKHLGGSPEVMFYLKRVDGRARGPVLYFFIDDPDNNIPLGPINPVQ